MKIFLSTILALAALVSVCRAEDPAYSDIDAENYIVSRNITDRAVISRVHAWYTGLKTLGLYSNIVHSVSYRSEHNAVNGSSVVAMNGGNGTITGSLGFTDRGVTYDGSSGNYIAYSNPLSNPFTNYTQVVFFDAPRGSGNYYHLFGSYNGATTKGPAIFVGGSPSAGAQDGFYYQFYSNDGTANNGGSAFDSDGLVNNPTWGTPTMVAAGVSDLDYRLMNGLDEMSENIAGGSATTIWNGGATWRLGQTLAGSLRLVGNVAYTGVWNELLTANKMKALRRLYSKTLGYGYMQKVQFIFDGDSLTKGTGAGEIPWPLQIQTNLTYGALVAHRNNAVSGATSGDVASQVLTETYPFNVNFDFCDRQYFFTYVGENDFASQSADTIFENLKTIWRLGRAAGYKIVAFTYTKTTLTASGSVSALTQRQTRDAVRAKILQNASLYDVLIKLDEISALQDQTDTTYYIDADHYTTAGHALIAAAVMRAIPIP